MNKDQEKILDDLFSKIKEIVDDNGQVEYDLGFEEGYDEGYDDGYGGGYEEGYNIGRKDGKGFTDDEKNNLIRISH